MREYRKAHPEKFRTATKKWRDSRPVTDRPFQNATTYPTDKDYFNVVYGQTHNMLRRIVETWGMDELDLKLLMRGEYYRRPGRQLHVYLYRPDSSTVLGGAISYGVPPHSGTVLDVKGMFQCPWSKLVEAYDTEDLAKIMEQTRASLRSVGLDVQSGHWHRNSAITDWLFSKLAIRIKSIELTGPEYLRRRPDWHTPIQGQSVRGFVEGPIYAYDINSSFNAIMSEIPDLVEFSQTLWKARQELKLKKDPTERVLKIAPSVLPGKFGSGQPRYDRPDIMWHIRNRAVQKMYDAMNKVIQEGGTVFRWNTDGFLANIRLDNLNEGKDLGQWRIEGPYESLTIMTLNSFWLGDIPVRDSGLTIRREDVINNPTKVPYTRTHIDWNGDLQEHVEQEISEYKGRKLRYSDGAFLTEMGIEVFGYGHEDDEFFGMEWK